MKNYYLFFEDSKTAIAFYSLAKDRGIKCTMAPTPREADACCGVSILYYSSEDKSTMEEIAKESCLNVMKFWECENKDEPNRFKFC